MAANENKIGGQALPNGLILRSRDNLARAVRKDDGTIEVETQAQPAFVRNPIMDTPFIRGPLLPLTVVFAFRLPRRGQMTLVGVKRAALQFVGLAMLLIGFPMLTSFAINELTIWTIEHITRDPLVLRILQGVSMIYFMFVLIGLAPLVPGVKTLFKYHGAEHKVVRATELGLPLDVDAVKPRPTAHKRCGTNLVTLYMLLSTAVAIAFPDSLYGLVPLAVFSVTYELTRFCADRADRWWARAVLTPGMAMQYFTAFEPTEQQLEVACACAKALLEADSAVLPKAK